MSPQEIEVVAPNFKRRLSGVTSTIVQLVPEQNRLGRKVAVLGPGLPADLPRLRSRDLAALRKPPKDKPFRVWHARRNVEMLAGIVLRNVLRFPLKLVFTSAAQRRHTGYTRALIRRMDAVIATSARSGSFLEVPHSVVMHGIDLNRFRPARTEDSPAVPTGLPGKHLVGCFGRVRHQKGTDLFVEAMIALLPSHPDWTAVVSGRTTPQHQAFTDDLKRRIGAAGLAERIVFLGEVDDIRPWYRRLSLYVAPSRNEGFGLTPLEAMASGTAVVASDAGAYAEMIVRRKTGDVVPAGDGDALREAIRPYLAEPDHALEQGQNALAHVHANFALAREAEGVGRVYDRL